MQNRTLGENRIVTLDVVRVLAVFMVLVTHATERFYVSNAGELIIQSSNQFWVNFFNSAFHACVPLFVVVSGYLLLPIKESPAQFYVKRIPKIFIPFVIWSIIYITLPLIWGGISTDAASGEFVRLLYNFSWTSGHLWFIYMLIGVYLFIPIISPWIKESSKRFEEGFLALWIFSTLYHFIVLLIPDRMLMGQNFFNEFSSIWYFSGYLGYAVLGHYIKTHVNFSRQISLLLGAVLYVSGFLMTFFLFGYQLDPASTLEDLTLSLRSCTINVAFMTAGVFLLLKDITINNQKILSLFVELSKFSFGIYLVHMLILPFIGTVLGETFNTPLTILVVSSLTFLVAYCVVKILSYLPKSGYLIAN